MTSTSPVAFSDQPAPGAADVEYAGVLKRAVALIIDGIIAFVGFGYGIAVVTGSTTETGFELDDGPAFLVLALIALYWVALEALFGATIGKLMLGIRVRRVDEQSVGFTASLIRNVLRLVDGMFGYLVGAILVWTSDRNQRLGDRAAGTIVVNR